MTTGANDPQDLTLTTSERVAEAQTTVSGAELAKLDRDELERRLIDTSGRITWQLAFLRGELDHYRKLSGSYWARPAERHVAGLVEDAIAGLERLQAALKGTSSEDAT